MPFPTSPSFTSFPFRTKTGQPKRRLCHQEKLDLLGCTDTHLVAFLELFAPKRKDFIITRAKSGEPSSWNKGHGLLNPTLLARHLLGNSLPHLNAQWLGARGAKTTYWFCLDLDNHANDTDDLHRRHRLCLQALAHIGITDAHVLTIPTPSKGLHLYVFFDRPIYTSTIEPTLAQIGITHTRRRIRPICHSHQPIQHHRASPIVKTIQRGPAMPESTTIVATDTPDQFPPLLTTKHMAKLLHKSERTVDRRDKNATIPSPSRVDSQRLWNRKEVFHWIDEGCPPRHVWERLHPKYRKPKGKRQP